MKIEHIAIYVKDLEKTKEFYVKYFNAEAGALYHNKATGFKSYFLSFQSGARLEIMNKSDLRPNIMGEHFGYAHLAISLGSEEEVNRLTAKLEKDGHKILKEPRVTGDGYYESLATDPDGNLIELTK